MIPKSVKKEEIRLGVDVGTRKIKAVEMASGKEIKRLIGFAIADIDPPFSEEKAALALKEVLSQLNPNTKEVRISLSAPHAMVRFISVPRMKEEDLKNSLKYEAEKYIPFNISEVGIDVSILEEKAEDEKQMKVLLAAAKKTIINSRMDMMKKAGLSTYLIDIDSFSCLNAFTEAAIEKDASKSVVLLNIGYTQTGVMIINQDKPLFTRDIQIGGKDMVAALAKTFNINDKEAEALMEDPKEKSAEVFECEKNVLNTLIEEIRLSFGYYENQHGKSIDILYLSGGIAKLPGIVEYFEETFGIKPSGWDPFTGFEIDAKVNKEELEKLKSQFAVAAGLILRK